MWIKSIIPSLVNLKKFCAGALALIFLFGCAVPAGAFVSKAPPPVVYHVQDIHGNFAAQKAIGKTLQKWMKNGDIQLVGLEGAFGPLDLSKFQNFEDQKSVSAVADYFLRQNLISGPIQAGLVAAPANAPAYEGVESEAVYRKNVEAFRNAYPFQKIIQRKMVEEKEKLQIKKNQIFGQSLFDFDAVVQLFLNQKISMLDYLHFLTSSTVELPSNLTELPKLMSALRALDLFSPEQVQKEAEKYLGEVRKRGVEPDFSGYPALRLRLLAQDRLKKLDFMAILQEIDRVEKSGYAALSVSSAEKELIEQDRKLRLVEKLVGFSLSSQEWAEYKSTVVNVPGLKKFELFYEYAEARDSIMADRLLQSMVKGRVRSAALVTGGFHAGGIRKKLESHGIRVESIVPEIKSDSVGKTDSSLKSFLQSPPMFVRFFEEAQSFLANEPMTPAVEQALVASVAIYTEATHPKKVGFLTLLKSLGGKFTGSSAGANGASEFVVESDHSRLMGSMEVDQSGEINRFGATSFILNPGNTGNSEIVHEGTLEQIEDWLSADGNASQALALGRAISAANEVVPKLGSVRIRLVENAHHVASLDDTVVVLDQRLLSFPRLLTQEITEEFMHLRTRYALRESSLNVQAAFFDEIWVALHKILAFRDFKADKQQTLLLNFFVGGFVHFGLAEIMLAVLDQSSRGFISSTLTESGVDSSKMGNPAKLAKQINGLTGDALEKKLIEIIVTLFREKHIFPQFSDFYEPASIDVDKLFLDLRKHQKAVMENFGKSPFGDPIQFSPSLKFSPLTERHSWLPTDDAFHRWVAGKKVGIVEPHPDDSRISMGVTEQALIKHGADIHHITVIPDQNGVTAEYLKSVGLPDTEENRRMVRNQEVADANHAAGILHANVTNLGIQIGLLPPEIFDSQDPTPIEHKDFPKFTTWDLANIEAVVRNNLDREVWFLPYPFSKHRRHPQHVITSLAFMEMIGKHCDNPLIIFYETRESEYRGAQSSFDQEGIRPNLLMWFGKPDMDKKMDLIAAYRSQVFRHDYKKEIMKSNGGRAEIEGGKGNSRGEYVERFLVGVVNPIESRRPMEVTERLISRFSTVMGGFLLSLVGFVMVAVTQHDAAANTLDRKPTISVHEKNTLTNGHERGTGIAVPSKVRWTARKFLRQA